MATNCVYWLKRDFRLHDNPALTAALAGHARVLPLFILEPTAVTAPETSAFHLHAQCDAFNDLHRRITAGGGQLAFAHAGVVDLLERLHARRPLTHLISHQETGNNRTYDRDRAVAAWCAARGVQWDEPLQTGVFRGELDRDRRHRRWEAFTKAAPCPVPEDLHRLAVPTDYAELVETFGAAAASATETPLRTASVPPTDAWLPLPELLGRKTPGPLQPTRFGTPLGPEQAHYVQPVSETAAAVTLRSFLDERASNYSKGMSSPNTAFYHCSRLSVHLAWGTVSLRAVYARVTDYLETLKGSPDERAKLFSRNLRSFLSRLHWHDHFTQRLETEVEMEFRPLNPNFHDLELEDSPTLLAAWTEGRTGFPMVDACIRCMQVTGYMNFRMRSMLTSTAAHMLHLDFRSIDKPMARLYTDYEPGIHLAQLQMQAGMVGINTLRTYSPEKQFTDHDPTAAFVHRWVPELRPFSAAEIARRDLTRGLGDYPQAVVDRSERIKAYKQLLGDLKFRPGGREITEAVFRKHGSRRSPRRKTAPKKAAGKG